MASTGQPAWRWNKHGMSIAAAILASLLFHGVLSQGCGETISNSSGTLTHSADLGTNCTWTFVTDGILSTRLTFYLFNSSQYYRNCYENYIQISDRDGQGEYGRFCESGYEQSVTGIRSNTLVVRFVSLTTDNSSDFAINASWVTVCERQYRNTPNNGVLRSPGYPDTYAANLSCWVTFNTNSRYGYRLTFTEFNLPNSTVQSCNSDYVEIYGWTSSSSWLNRRLCGTDTPPVLEYTYLSSLTFRSSQQASAGYGFKVNFTKIIVCQETQRTGPSGQIRVNLYDYEHIAGGCTYNITVEDGHYVILRIDRIQVENTEGCQQFVKIYDGDSPTEANLLRTFCEYQPNTFLESTSNKMLIEFYTNGNSTYMSGSISYFESEECQPIHLTEPQGEFQIPASHSTQNLRRNGVCIWNISAEEGSVILLGIKNFNIRPYDYVNRCNASYLKIYDGVVENENHLIRNLCRQSYSSTGLMISTSNNLLVVLTLQENAGYAQVELSARYSTANASQMNRDCGGSQTGREGIITSPNYPNNYDSLTECQWLITVDPAFTIRSEIEYSFPDNSYDCSSDALIIWNGNNTFDTYTIASLCGGSGFRTYYRSSGNQFLVRFTSDMEITAAGFNMSWFTVCDTYVDYSTASTLQSPYYPDNYPSNLSCVYRFWYYYPGHSVAVSFSAFQLEGPDSNGSCTKDYLKVISHSSSADLALGMEQSQRYCGDNITSTLTLYPPVDIHFITDLYNSSSGFQASYEFIKADCGQSLFTGETGTVTSPNYPGTFPRDINCTYVIRVDPGETIYLAFDHLSLARISVTEDQGQACIRSSNYWYGASLRVIDGEVTLPSAGGGISGNDSLIGFFCGSRAPPPMTSTGNVMTLYFASSYNYRLRGFSATYTTSGASTIFRDCGGEVSGQGGQIVSPNYPELYPNNSLCVWTLTGWPGDTVRVTFTHLDLEDFSDCQRDLLEFRDGPHATDTRLDRVCGDVIPYDVTSTGNVMRVRFITDLQNSRPGFNISWISLCEETFRASSGTITTPAATNGSRECTYIIEQRQSYLVQVDFTQFHLGNDGDNCQNNFIEVRDGGYEGSPLLGQRYCGANLPPQLTSSQNMMWIRYVTDGSDLDAGFRATYRREEPSCGSFVLREQKGTITSPQHPNNYPNRMDCTWEIVAEANHVIQLTFDTFMLEGSSNCHWDWVEIFDGTTRLGKFCGVSGPDQMTSTSNRMTVKFTSDWSVTFQGFSASYNAFDPYSDDLTRQYDLYPYGEGDKKLVRQHDKAKKVVLDTGFPVGNQLQYKVFVANKGLVSFGKREKGKQLKLKNHKAMICPYHSDIGAWDSNGGVYYQVYTDNKEVLDKASREIREFTEHRDYTASLVLVVTWDHVAHISSLNATTEQATVQLALISDGRRSYGVVFYKQGEMKWSALYEQPLIIGISDGQQEQPTYSIYTDTTEAFTKMDTIKGNTGRYGMWLYTIGDSYSADQQCQDWYTRNLPLKEERLTAFQRLPECPCSWRFIWGNWRWSHWRSGYDVLCFRMTVGRSRQLAPYGKECCYTWNWWQWSSFGQFISDPPHAGSATAFNPAFWSLQSDYQREDHQAHDVCCYNTTSDRYCNMYYELRPVGECSTKIPFSFSWTWGDPHIKTLDGGEYTFNGWGEYTMIALTSDDLTFTLQGRTGLAETESGSITNATVFTAFGAEENGVRVFVGLDPNTNESLIIYGNNSDYSTAFRDAGDDEVLVDSEIYMLKRSNQSFVVTFASEIQLTVSIGFKSLDISISLPLQYRNLTKGLLGNFNGVKDDDFVLPSGTSLNSDLTDRQIYEDFGPEWAVAESSSVMRYGPREGPADFAHPEFAPIFLDEVAMDTRQAAEDLCGATNVACIYDYVATGSVAIANASGNTANAAEEREKITKNTVPVLTFNGTINGTSGETLNFNLQGHDPDTDDVLSYHVVNDGDGTVQVNSQTGDVTLNLDSTKPVSLSFYAVDSTNVQSPIRDVTVITCSGCTNHGTCDFSRTTVSAVTGFLIAACDCDPAWTGENCDEDDDACEESPCDVHQVCTDLTPDQRSDVGFACTGCPDGFHIDPDDSTRCIDIDECSQQNKCTHLCTNLPGSYTCGCRDGYRLSSDDVNCDDINECAEKTDECQQQCVNTDGNFQCQCFPGYTLSSKGSCEANSTTSDLCSSAGCDHDCTTTTDGSSSSVAHCFCFNGYIINPANNRSCVDRDECSEGVCSQSCTNTQGSFACTCYTGHVMSSDQRTCNPCPKLRYGPECRHTCECNGRGRSCHPVTGCVCQSGWTGSQCQDDVNECQESPDVCGEGKRCVNNNGSYACLCPDGYTDNSGGVCRDIDECSEGSTLNTCGELEQCHNVPGSFYCTCNTGYTLVNGQCTDLDECGSTSQNQCQQQCSNVPGSYTCHCRYGYRLNVDRSSCSQVADVCAEFEGLECDHGCSLNDDDRAFCFCRTGFVLGSDLQSCQDEDECSLGIANCSANSECVNTQGSYTCRCPIGSKLDNGGHTCLPCPTATYGENCTKFCACGLGASRCDVTTGCVCKSGWTGERCDQDINECDTVQTQEECLAQKALCVNLQGGYKCSCALGYQNVSNVCQDVDECDKSPCEQQCENSPGSYRCLCNEGFSFNVTSGTCVDINECAVSVTNDCTQRCDNTPGSYRCSCDVTGYVLDNDGVTCSATSALCNRTDCPTENGGCSEEGCFCNNGYQLTGTNSCEWIDEDLCAGESCEQGCAESSDGRSVICSCDDGYILNNDKRTCRECAAGTYGEGCNSNCSCNLQNTANCDHVNGTCSCKAGWEGAACDDDINECKSSGVTCGANSTCHDTAGSYVCQCETGYVKNTTGHCQECAPRMYGTNCAQQCMCTTNAKWCNHFDGACVCKAGWEGARCENDVNECLTNQHSCSGDHVICVNQNGGFSCGCEDGYKINGSNTCIDMDECFDNRENNCEQECTNTIGSYTCNCSTGYLGSGNDCRALTRVAMTVTLQITAPPELSNPFGTTYAAWMQMAEDALYAKLKPDVPGLQAIIILSLRLGSLVIDSEAVVNNETHPDATSDLTLALLDMGQGQLTIGSQTGDVGLKVGGVVVNSSTSACTVYEHITGCASGQQCRLKDGAPSCQDVTGDDDFNQVLYIVVGVYVAVVIAAVLITLAVFKHKKSATNTGPILETDVCNSVPMTTSFSQHSRKRGTSVGTTSPTSFNSLSSSRQSRPLN